MNLLRIAARVAAEPEATCVYVDLDETLVHTVSLRDDTEAARFRQFPGEKLEMGTYGSMLRPGARELLAALKSFGPVYLLTYSVETYASTLCSAFGLDVDAIFPRESLSGRVGNGEDRFVLVDDLEPMHPVVQTKMLAAGVPRFEPGDVDWSDEAAVRAHDEACRDYYASWQVRPPEFLGRPDDRGLEGVVELVGQAVSSRPPPP